MHHEGDLPLQAPAAANSRKSPALEVILLYAPDGTGLPDRWIQAKTVDREGNRNLIGAAQAHAIEHFVLVSIIDAAPGHPLELWRMKYLAEQELKASGLAWTVIRATAFMEWCVDLLGGPLMKTGRARIFGDGNNPINFVSAGDVARFVELAIIDPSMRDLTVDVGGPENLTLNQVAHTLQTVTGKHGAVSHVPVPVMRIMSRLMRPINPGLAREIQAGVFLDTEDRTADSTTAREAYPSIPTTTLTDVVRQEYATRTTERALRVTSGEASQSGDAMPLP